jgi:hypothetical protein
LKAKGKRLSTHEPKKIIALESLPEPEIEESEETVDSSDVQSPVSEKPNIVIDLEGDEPQMRLFDEP